MPEFFDRYDPSTESDTYATWEASGAFKPNDSKETFSVLMPPTNANGALHVGHGVGVTIQDLLVRYHRMNGKATVWWPGLDHAGFETQIVAERLLEKEGRSHFSMPRDEFHAYTEAFTNASKGKILEGLKRLGASADWDRLFYTLDDDIVTQVYDTFVTLHRDQLAYRDVRPVNWCTKHQTTLSDLETSDEDRTEPLYYLKYGPLVVATGRPETIFADVAVAVHPDDARYKALVGTDIEVNLGIETRKLPVIADDYVNPEFGTGAVKITPAHDPNDFEVAKRHHLPLDVETIDRYGKLTDRAGKYAGMKVVEARAAVVEHLQELGLIEKINDQYQHAVKVCYKCKRTIEPRILPQWFVAMNQTGSESKKNLTKLALEAVESGEVNFVTDRFRKIFNHWLENIRDWPVSRQIVWGIQLPVWYCQAGLGCAPIVQNPMTSGEPTACPTCSGHNLLRDLDVFDTWFSSTQLPVLVPNRERFAEDFARFYPTAVMETGWEIIFFWVARMIMFGRYLTNDVPFRTVYLHGLVRDKDRQKMSKSKGNVIDPLAVTEEYGADALRMALVFGTAAGNDMPMSEDKIRGMRNFSTKLWNIARFVRMSLSEGDTSSSIEPTTDADRAILEGLATTTKTVTTAIDDFQFQLAAEAIYDFIWNQFASTYLEASKEKLKDEQTASATRAILTHVLKQSLALLHPFMPFVTEAIWVYVPKTDTDSQLLITQAWPSEAK